MSDITMRLLLVAVILCIVYLGNVQGGCASTKLSEAVIKKKFKPYTKTNSKGKPIANSPCWWDLTKNNCGTCQKGGKQCGYPMHKWCQSPKSKFGCQGIPNFKYTLSTEGAPCFWDPNNLKCSICTKKTVKQCENTKTSDIEKQCYSTCGSAKDKKCDGNLFSCLTIPRCGVGAACDPRSGQCRCTQGTSGNGQQCFQGDCAAGNCTLLVSSEQNVQVEIDTQSQYFVYAHGSEL